MGTQSAQTSFTFRTWGGAREGAGRPRKKRAPGDPQTHEPRPAFHKDDPVLVTVRIARGVPSIRNERIHDEIRRVLDVMRAREDAAFQVVHFSIQWNHLHLIVEAKGKEALIRGVQGLEVRVARAVNRVVGRKGRVFADRYHRRDLKNPRQTRYALAYVLNNSFKHAPWWRGRPEHGMADPYSSGVTFDGWEGDVVRAMRIALSETEPWPRIAPWTWMLRTGWRKHGRISAA